MDIKLLEFNNENFKGIPQYDLDYAKMEYGRGLEYFENRVKALNFTGKDKILDAGCGVGQWSLIFSRHNKEVAGVDIREERLNIAGKLVEINSINNIKLVNSRIEELPFNDNTFDAVFCYGVIMFVDPEKQSKNSQEY